MSCEKDSKYCTCLYYSANALARIMTKIAEKAFNTIGAHIMVSPQREEGVPDLLIAGNDADAKKWVNDLALS